MSDEPTLERMKWAAEYRVARDAMRTLPVLLICGGCFGMAVCGTSFADPIARRTLGPILGIAVAGCVVAAGLWFLLSPRRAMLHVQAALCSALLFVSVGWILVSMRGGPRQELLVIGFLAVGLSLGLVGRTYRAIASLRTLPPGKPDAASVAWVDRTVKYIEKGDPRKQADLLVLDVAGAKWRARLLEKAIMFVVPVPPGNLSLRRTQVILVARDEMDVVAQGDAMQGKRCAVTLRLGQRELKATIEEELLHRFRAWKSADAAVETGDVAETQVDHPFSAEPSPSIQAIADATKTREYERHASIRTAGAMLLGVSPIVVFASIVIALSGSSPATMRGTHIRVEFVLGAISSVLLAAGMASLGLHLFRKGHRGICQLRAMECQLRAKEAERAFAGHEALREYVLNAPGISRLWLNVMCLVGLFTFGWLLGVAFQLLWNARKGWLYILPIMVLLALAAKGEPGLFAAAALLYVVGWIDANFTLSRYQTLGRARVKAIDAQQAPHADSLVEQGLLYSRVLRARLSARRAFATALAAPEGGSAALFDRAGRELIAIGQPGDAASFFARALSACDDPREAERIKKNQAAAMKKAVR